MGWKIFTDLANLKKFLFHAVGNIEEFEFDNFLAIFIKGIFRDVVIGIA